MSLESENGILNFVRCGFSPTLSGVDSLDVSLLF